MSGFGAFEKRSRRVDIYAWQSAIPVRTLYVNDTEVPKREPTASELWRQAEDLWLAFHRRLATEKFW